MISRVALTVRELSRSVKFYEKALNFQQIGSYTIESPTAGLIFGMTDANPKLSVTIAVLTLGEEVIELMEFQNSAPIADIPADSASNDLWFQHLAVVVANMDTAWGHLKMFDIDPISPAPQTLPGYLEAAGISAYYFKDPDGHVLELIHFPKEKGDSKWHEKKAGLFLGIDHTAIVVKDTNASLPFYEELGFTKEAQMKNYGSQQEKLDQVKDARMLVTSLASEAGMGVEFLDFKKPEDGRSFPKDARPNDLIHWHTVIEADDLPATFDRMKQAGNEILSENITRITDWEQDEYHGFLVRDKDGHAVLVIEK